MPDVVTSVDVGDEVKVAIIEKPVVVVTPTVGPQGLQGPPGPPGSSSGSFQTVHTFALTGEIKVDTGSDFIPPFYVMIAPGQTTSLVKVRHRINSGTNVQCKLQKNGVDITGFNPISVSTTTATTDPVDVPLADGDSLALVVIDAIGQPHDMSFTLVLEHLA